MSTAPALRRPLRTRLRGKGQGVPVVSKVRRRCIRPALSSCSHDKSRPQTRHATTKSKRCYDRTHQYSITALTDGAGQVVERYAYTAYGEPTILDASLNVLPDSAVGNRYLYTGREWDGELGLYHYRERMYSANSGRFVSPDPIGFFGSKWSLYGNYFGLSSVDPLGLTPPFFPPPGSPGIDPQNPTDYCELAASLAQEQLDTEEERKLFRRYAGGTGAAFNFTNDEACEALGSITDDAENWCEDSCRCNKKGPQTPFNVVGQASSPWTGGLGGVDARGHCSCGPGSSTTETCFDNTYDFDPKSWLDRSIEGEVKTRIVNNTNRLLDCGWTPFQMRGCCKRHRMIPL